MLNYNFTEETGPEMHSRGLHNSAKAMGEGRDLRSSLFANSDCIDQSLLDCGVLERKKAQNL